MMQSTGKRIGFTALIMLICGACIIISIYTLIKRPQIESAQSAQKQLIEQAKEITAAAPPFWMPQLLGTMRVNCLSRATTADDGKIVFIPVSDGDGKYDCRVSAPKPEDKSG